MTCIHMQWVVKFSSDEIFYNGEVQFVFFSIYTCTPFTLKYANDAGIAEMTWLLRAVAAFLCNISCGAFPKHLANVEYHSWFYSSLYGS